MSPWIFAVLAGIAVLAVLVFRSGGKKPPLELPRFDFDKNKSYEREGRKFPFSY